VKTPRPYNLVAELTYRCPLRCAYCSNPLGFSEIRDGLDTTTWERVFHEAGRLGVVHVGLTGGEPTLRPDLPRLVAAAAEAGLYTHLVTAGLPLDRGGLAELATAGLRSVQVSVQSSHAAESDEMAGSVSFDRKLAFARAVRELSLPLTLNVVLHRGNLARVGELVALARRLDADRLELANVQLQGWALPNRAALLPTREALAGAAEAVAQAMREGPRPEILFVLPDYWSDRPKPCMGGWATRTIVVRPDGLVLPCHLAGEIPDLAFGSVVERPLAWCWQSAPGMNRFRGESWMPEPCRSCPERGRDFGGCRCQAFALTGDAAATDPACALAPAHGLVQEARAEAERGDEAPGLIYRSARRRTACDLGS